jgi:hypothetical protein
MRLLLLVVLGLAFPASALGGSWVGSWTNAGVGTNGSARLTLGPSAALHLDGAAFGCAAPVALAVHVGSGRVAGSGGNLPCNHGLHWTVSGSSAAPLIRLRLPDGSSAELRLELRRR